MPKVLKFAVGVRKGLPLESAGMPYQIVNRDGLELAHFNNGAMARFYREDVPEPVAEPYIWKPKDPMPARPVPSPGLKDEWGARVNIGALVPVESPQSWTVTVVPYRGFMRSRPMHPCDPAYAVMQDGQIKSNVTRQEVGQGLRELLWLYEKLRQFGRGRFAAIREARKIYFL